MLLDVIYYTIAKVRFLLQFMIGVTELRAGTAFRLDNQLWTVVKYEHVKMGRGTATIKIKARNLETGSIVEKSFISGARIEEANTTRQEMTYLYADGDNVVLMDPQTYEQFTIPQSVLEDKMVYMKEGENIIVLTVTEEEGVRALTVDLPPKMTFTVKEAEPGVKGDSAANMLKKAVLENGMEIKVPLFIKTGEKVRIDTRTGEYVERASAE